METNLAFLDVRIARELPLLYPYCICWRENRGSNSNSECLPFPNNPQQKISSVSADNPPTAECILGSLPMIFRQQKVSSVFADDTCISAKFDLSLAGISRLPSVRCSKLMNTHIVGDHTLGIIVER